MRLKKIALIILFLTFVILLSGCENKNEEDQMKQKTDASIQFLDDSLISMLNGLNNISYVNYYVTTEKVKVDSKSKSGSDSSENSKSSEVSQGNDSNQNSGEQSSEGKNGQQNDNEKITVSDMKSKNILLSDRSTINWEKLKSEIENLYSSWNTILIDLYKLGISNDDIFKFSSYLDNTVASMKMESRESTLLNLSALYGILPSFMDSYSDNRTSINIKWTKAHIIRAYSAVGNKDWNTVVSEIAQADQSYGAVMSDADFVNEKSYNTNKTYVSLKEMQNSLSLQDEDIFYIKYKNFMQEINLL